MAENTAIVNGVELPISTKESVEICNFIRNKNLNDAKKMLENVIKLKVAVPYKRYNQDTPHRKGRIAAGRFPVKASKEILSLLKSVESNASHQGLDTNNLVIKQAIANMGSRQFHYGRKRRIQMKRTHINFIVEERVKENKTAVKNKK